MFFILHNTGTGGDMVAAVIDSTDYVVTDIDVRPKPRSDRYRFRDSIINCHNIGEDIRHMLFDSHGKTEYLKNVEQKYLSLTTSHDFTFVEHEHASNTDIIIIDDTDEKYNKWGMHRCHTILSKHHPPASDEELANRLWRVNLAKRFTDKVIPFSDILEGRLIYILQQWVDTPLNAEIYNHWLSTIMTKGPKIE